MTTYPSKRQATSDSSDTSALRGVTRGVTPRGRNYSGLAAGGDSSDSILQAILSLKKKRGERAEGNIDFIRNPHSRHTPQNTVTTVTTCHDPRNIQASRGDSSSDSSRHEVSLLSLQPLTDSKRHRPIPSRRPQEAKGVLPMNHSMKPSQFETTSIGPVNLGTQAESDAVRRGPKRLPRYGANCWEARLYEQQVPAVVTYGCTEGRATRGTGRARHRASFDTC